MNISGWTIALIEIDGYLTGLVLNTANIQPKDWTPVTHSKQKLSKFMSGGCHLETSCIWRPCTLKDNLEKWVGSLDPWVMEKKPVKSSFILFASSNWVCQLLSTEFPNDLSSHLVGIIRFDDCFVRQYNFLRSTMCIQSRCKHCSAMIYSGR